MRSVLSFEPSVICHTHWNINKGDKDLRGQGLRVQPEYLEAKKAGDFDAANAVVSRLLTTEGLMALHDRVFPKEATGGFYRLGNKPIIVAPLKPMDLQKNLLPVAMAHRIGYELRLTVSEEIVQIDTHGRTGKDTAFRLAHQPEFEGRVEVGRPYILVDDNLTLGGTLMSLASYIQSNGGKVIAMTALADSERVPSSFTRSKLAHEAHLGLSQSMLDDLRNKFGPRFSSVFEKEVGFPMMALTEREAACIYYSLKI
jgi:hypothetical protein